MDIEKICRCCLALSGPLLSIYDGGSPSGGRVADMMREITKLKPQQNDKMPEKVCLSCISEINRCYVFKIKCESSNQTLHQLIPDAVKEYSDSPQKSSHCDAGVQTETEKFLRSIHVQTITPEEKNVPATADREIQTVFNFSSDTEEETNSNNIAPSTPEEFLVCVKGDGTAVKRKRSKDSPTQSQTLTKKKIRFEDEVHHISDDTEDEQREQQQQTFILVESINNDSYSSDEHALFVHATSSEQPQDAGTVKNESPSSSRFEFYDAIEEETVDEGQIPKGNDCVQTREISSGHLKGKDNSNNSILNECSRQTNASSSSNQRSSNQRREQYKCSLCIMTFVSRNVLRRHLAKRHSVADSQIAVEDVAPGPILENTSNAQHAVSNDQIELTMENVPKPHLLPRGPFSPKIDDQLYTKFKYYCDNCQAGFAQRKTLSYHMKQNICMTSNFKCNQCDRIFISQDNLDTHKTTHNNQHTCLECNKVCSSVVDLSEHMIEEHNRNARNQCHVCKKVFTMKASLMDHLRIHSGEKPFLCTVCGKTFRQNSNLRQHLMRHTNEKNFKCDMCSNTYVTKAELFSHSRTHTGDHPFKCEICSTCFTSSSSLLKHKRKHTGERPYACEFCPMRFSALNVLKNHRRTHTGEKPYKCDFCDKCFTQKGDCLLHQRTHEFGDVKCFCGSKFSKISNLKQHIKSKHPNMTDEKRREMNDALNKPNESGTELHITLMEDIEDEVGDTSHFVTISSIDNSFRKSQHHSVNDDNEELSTEIIVEDMS